MQIKYTSAMDHNTSYTTRNNKTQPPKKKKDDT